MTVLSDAVLRRADQASADKTANGNGDDVVHVREMLRRIRESISEIGSAADAILAVRRSDAVEKVVQDALKTCRLLEREQFELKQEAAEIHLRTQRRAGQLLMAHAKHRGGRPKTDSSVEPVSAKPPTLRELGLDAHESHRWQRIGGIPDAEFEQFITSSRQRRRELTMSAAMALARQFMPEPDGGATGRHEPRGDDRTARGEYYRARRSIGNLIQVDPRALAADLRADERYQAAAELGRFQTWITEFLKVLDQNADSGNR